MAALRPRRYRRGRHRPPRSRGGPIVLGVLAVLAVAAVVAVAAYVVRGDTVSAATGSATTGSAATGATPTVAGRTALTGSSPPSSAHASSTHPSPHRSDPPATTGTHPAASTGTAAPRDGMTRDGHWWGVDSSGPITRASIRNVADWYRGARPHFWGRYLMGSYAVTRSELAFARAQHIYVYLIVNDRNCSGCSGGDVCGNDRTSDQAQDDAQDAVRSALRLGVPAGAVLFKDIEQVSSCRGEPTSAYLLGWYRALRHSRYRTGFYGNTYRPYYDFPVGYCAAAAASSSFAADVVLDMNEPEPALGAPRGGTGPRDAPAFAPSEPRCTPTGRTMIWQYGESTDPANLTDIDQAAPTTPGMLAPDGSVT